MDNMRPFFSEANMKLYESTNSGESTISNIETTQIAQIANYESCEIITKEQYTQFESLGESMNLLDLDEDFNG